MKLKMYVIIQKSKRLKNDEDKKYYFFSAGLKLIKRNIFKNVCIFQNINKYL